MLAESRGAASGIGGDFFAFQLHAAHRLSLVIGDACGRGEDAARLLPSVLPRLERLSRSSARPSELLQLLNDALVKEMPSDRFVTGAALELDAHTGLLTIANAGHVPGVLRTRNGSVRVIGPASGPPLGLSQLSHYHNDSYRIARGDVMVLMTDGVLEAVETDLTRMSTLTRLIARAPAGSTAVQRSLLTEFRQKQITGRVIDDATLLSLEVIASPTVSRQPLLTFAAAQ